jgi:hypothetical protein
LCWICEAVPTVAILEGVKIQFYPREHPPSHSHAVTAEYRAQIGIEMLAALKGSLPRSKLAAVVSRAQPRRAVLQTAWDRNGGETAAGKNRMNDILRIAAVEPVLHGVLKLTWNDGYEGIVDLWGIISHGEIFEHLRDPRNFRQARVESYGHFIYWGEEGNEFVDFGCDQLREIDEEQAALLARVS